MDDCFVKSIWPYEEMDFMEVDSDGSAGGLLCIYRPDIFKLRDCCCGKNFILLSGTSCYSFECVIVNIYAPNETVCMRQLWELLVNVYPHYSNPWCVGGDFNEIRLMCERKGCSRRDRGRKDFNEFIDKIDRFLLDPRWLEKFSLKQWGLSRTISDHCPILLKEDERDWGLKPFKFLNPWLSHPTFLTEVKQIWENIQVSGSAGYRLMRNLKELKSHQRVWNKEVFGNIDNLLKSAEEELHDWDLKAESRTLADVELSKRREDRSLVWKLSRDKERLRL
ncbi:uncharacterized protein LOC114266375 [Camellia sinensis]|uniref:uncharacterized protein LOC114266375 n=1 Tax=Camellia sinensis TaxID=4442 RepID=UPI0010366347|nr:uncharacterized protein LOC114266375 [Camellia sinensis]